MNVHFWLENFTNGERSEDLSVCQINRSQWPRGLRRSFAAARLLGLRVRIPLRARMFVAHAVCSVDSGICDKMLTHSEGFYRVCVCVCVFVSFTKLKKRRPKSDLRLASQKVKGHLVRK
jgi:hypothetical protein